MRVVHEVASGEDFPEHTGYHYGSTAVEWRLLLQSINRKRRGGTFDAKVTIDDGIAAVEAGLKATTHLFSHQQSEPDATA